MELGVVEFAGQCSLSPRRVLQLIHAGKISARLSGGRWLISQEELKYRPSVSRPLSAKMGKALLAYLSGGQWESELDPKSQSRIREYFSELTHCQNPSQLLASWFAGSNKKYLFEASDGDLKKLRFDERLILSGVSDDRAGISDSTYLEGFLVQKDFKQVVREYLLLPSRNPNVQIRIAALKVDDPIPLGLMLLDLAEHIGSRESAQVKKIIRSL
jgi:hypothetical protein